MRFRIIHKRNLFEFEIEPRIIVFIVLSFPRNFVFQAERLG